MNLRDTVAAAEVIRAAQTGARVALATDSGDVIYGIARRIGGDHDDILETSLEVTTTQGFETSWAMRELIDKVFSGEFVVGVTFPN